MRIPLFWAEAGGRHREAGRQVTVRRYGWSDTDQGAAQRHAEERAGEALARIQAGEKLTPREVKVPYNGADGLPIREEVLEQHLDGAAIITRNSYGARCLNVEDVLFADVDHVYPEGGQVSPASCAVVLGAALLGLLVALANDGSWPRYVAGFGLVSMFFSGALVRAVIRYFGGPEAFARGRLERFVERHPDWRVRSYATPAGLRLLAMHRTFDPVEDREEIDAFFRAVKADRTYVRMCRAQRCFRARLSPKPWRMGIGDHLKPRPGVWPVHPDRRPERDAWIARYEERAKEFAACHFGEVLGSDTIDPRAAAVRDLHDGASQALSGQPMA